MNKMIKCANSFIKKCDWTDIAMLKCCLLSLGMMLGMAVARKKKKMLYVLSFFTFVITCAPLVSKFMDHYHNHNK